jgi:hypothetical protein
MKKIIYTSTGKIERELTKQERDELAAKGDQDAKQDLLKEEMQTASTVQQQLDAIKKFLGV